MKKQNSTIHSFIGEFSKKVKNEKDKSIIVWIILFIFTTILSWVFSQNILLSLGILISLLLLFVLKFLYYDFNHTSNYIPSNKFTSIVTIIVLFLLLIIWLSYFLLNASASNNNITESKKNTSYTSVITPSNELRPQNKLSNLPPEYLVFILGATTVGVKVPNDSCQIVSTNKGSFFTVKKDRYGLFIDAIVYDEARILVCAIKDNVVEKNPNNFSTIERPDDHTIRIKDSKNQIVLYLKYLNPTTVELSGNFYIPPDLFISIDESIIKLGRLLRGTKYVKANQFIKNKPGKLFEIDDDGNLFIMSP